MSNYIYTVTAITKDGKDSRCFGFYFEKEMAKSAVKINKGDIQECLYKYIVVEKQRWGVHSIAEQIQWYKWVGEDSLSDESGQWVECEKPENERFARIVSWNGVG